MFHLFTSIADMYVTVRVPLGIYISCSLTVHRLSSRPARPLLPRLFRHSRGVGAASSSCGCSASLMRTLPQACRRRYVAERWQSRLDAHELTCLCRSVLLLEHCTVSRRRQVLCSTIEAIPHMLHSYNNIRAATNTETRWPDSPRNEPEPQLRSEAPLLSAFSTLLW